MTASDRQGLPALDQDLETQISPLFIGEGSFRSRLDTLEKEHPDREPLGLLLSGGSARAYAHIGVLKKLEEANIIPDFIVANSMGAIVALLYAAGFAPDDIERIITLTPLEELFKPVVPLKGGILDPGHFADIMGELFHDTKLEELAIPTLIVCDDLVSKRQVWLAEGPLVETFLAAFSMPMYFPPVPHGPLRLVDGGTSNLIPATVPAQFTSRFIVAATFYEGKGLNFRNPITIINRNFSIAKERAAICDIERKGGLLIRCAVEDFSFMDYSQIDRIILAGYHSTEARIDAIRQQIGENPHDLSTLRATRQEALLKTERTIALGRHPRHYSPRITMRGGLTLPDNFNARFRLEPESTLDLKLVFEGGHFAAQLGGWTSLARVGAGASARFTLSPPGPFTIETGASWCPEWTWIQGVIGATAYAGSDLILESALEAELLLDSAYQSDDQWIAANIGFRPRDKIQRVYPTLALGGFLRSEGDTPYTAGVEGRFGTKISLAGPLEVRAGILGRWSPTYRLFTPFPSDPWRGPASGPVRLPQVWTNGEIALAFRDIGISLAESFQIPRIDLALYTDILLSRDEWQMANGLSLAVTASLIGLSSLSASLYAGRDWQTDTFFWAVRLGILW